MHRHMQNKADQTKSKIIGTWVLLAFQLHVEHHTDSMTVSELWTWHVIYFWGQDQIWPCHRDGSRRTRGKRTAENEDWMAPSAYSWCTEYIFGNRASFVALLRTYLHLNQKNSYERKFLLGLDVDWKVEFDPSILSCKYQCTLL